MKFWQVAVFFGVGFLLAYLLFGREGPPPPTVIREVHTDTLPGRVDTVRIANPVLLAEANRLRSVVAGFLANPSSDTTDTCIAYLAASLELLDSLRAAITAKPAVRLTLSDSLTAKWPIKALWLAVQYRAEGDTAITTWDYRQWPAPLSPKSRFGAIFGYGVGCGGFAGAQIRLDQSKALLAAKSEKGWQAGLVWFVK